jgi:hypothetical protein
MTTPQHPSDEEREPISDLSPTDDSADDVAGGGGGLWSGKPAPKT